MDKGKISEKPYNPKQHVEYKDGKRITKNDADKSSERPYNYIKFNEEKRKQEIERLRKLVEKNRILAYILNFIFPGVGLFYLRKKGLGILLIIIMLIIYIYVRGMWLITAVFTYNLFTTLFLVSSVFEPNSFLTDEDVLKYAPGSIKAFRVKASRFIKSPFSTAKKYIKHTSTTKKNTEKFYKEFKDYEDNNDLKTHKIKKYKEDINDLKAKYQSKEEVAKKIIKEHFPPPQLTYDRFMGEIDMWSEIFHRQVESTLNIINITEECTAKVDEELKNRLEILKSVVEKMDELVVELTINLGNSNRETTVGEVKELLTDMQNVIDSVKEYN
ncbi:MAG: hypothetical protein LBD03_04760 [Methanobrevibacter sp.]|jgi:TM2 domain-containing membrane protein YozV|nr:hypothetical protein [Candidatus Methanovirga procula]